MLSKHKMLFVACIWLALVMVLFFYTGGIAGFHIRGHNPRSRHIIIALLAVAHAVLLLGWIVPLCLGISRLVRKTR